MPLSDQELVELWDMREAIYFHFLSLVEMFYMGFPLTEKISEEGRGSPMTNLLEDKGYVITTEIAQHHLVVIPRKRAS